VETRKTQGAAGYSGFTSRFHGVILAGYSNGLRPGPCLVNGRRSRIPEVGMQSAFVELQGDEKPGDEVVLLGDSLTEQDVAHAWNTTAHEALLRLTGMGPRSYRG
jgi:alanine racemase